MEKISQICKKHVIGITGNIASGKSFVGSFLKKNGYFVIDADKLNNLAIMQNKSEIINICGTGVQKNDDIDKNFLRDLFFNDEIKRIKIEKLLHPLIKKMFENILLKNYKEKDIIFYESPLIIQKKIYKIFKKNIICKCSKQTQIDRLLKFRKMPYRLAKKIIKYQKKSIKYIKVQNSMIINTDCDKNKLERFIYDNLNKIID